MAVESFTPIAWQPGELITEAKMDAIGQNLDYLNERKINGVYNHVNTGNIRINLKIAAGVATIEPDPNGVTGKNVYFGDYFSAGCKPVVVGNIVSDSTRRIHLTQAGLGTMFPDHTGLRFVVRTDEYNTANNGLSRTVYVSWIAIGY